MMTWIDPKASKDELNALELIAQGDLITAEMIADTKVDPRTRDQGVLQVAKSTVPLKPKTKRSKRSVDPGQTSFA